MFEDLILQNTDHRWFAQCSFAMAQMAARDLAGSCQRDKVHHTERKQFHAGTHLEERKTRSSGKTTDGLKTRKTETSGTSFVSIPEYETVEVPVFEGHDAQLFWRMRDILELKERQCWVKEMGGPPRFIAIGEVEDYWVFQGDPELKEEPEWKKKLHECLTLLKTKPEYQAPVEVALPATTSKAGAAARNTAAKGGNGSGNGSAFMPRSSSNASGTTPPAKQNGRSTPKRNTTSDGS